MSESRPSFYLVHVETGQRYPIKASVVIGRLHGDIVFARDMKLSNKHCEVTPAEGGLAVRDLESANGTRINGKTLGSSRAYLLTPDAELSMGEQDFTLKSVSRSKRVKKRKSKRPRKGSDGFSFIYVAVIVAILVFAWKDRNFDRVSPLQLSQKQLGEIFENYQDLQMSLERQTVPPREVSSRIQSTILEHLSAISRRWTEFQPADPEQQQSFTEQLQFASALAGHAKTELLYIQTGDAKYIDEMDRWTAQVEETANALHREPVHGSAAAFPTLLQSPLQIVEREMRQALRDYKLLGQQVQNHQVSEQQMDERIRRDLMPKLDSVYAKMGAIVAENDYEKRKVVLEQRLMTAFLGQVKYLSLYTDSKDPKYAHELEYWTAQLEKANGELKQQLNPNRTPAAK